MIKKIKERKLVDNIEIINEVIKPVAEKWNDGLIHETNNLQVTFRSTSKKNLEDVMVYLYYYDSQGNELGYEFDIPEAKIRPGTDARVSLMLTPPKEYSYTILEIKAEEENKENYFLNFLIMSIITLAIYLFSEFW